MPNPRATTVLAALLVLTAGCTSSRLRESPPKAATTPQVSTPITSGPTTPTAPAGSTTSAPTGLTRIRGAILLLGSNPDTANVYEVTTGAFRALTSLPRGSRVSDVTADAEHLVITDDARTHADHLDVVQGSELTDLGLGAAFGPSLSAAGRLTWVALENGAPTPGITKPTSSVVGVRDSLQGTSRIVYRSTSSLASPQWTGPHTVVVAASDGRRTQLVRIDTSTRATRVLATMSSSDALDLTAGPGFLTAWDGARATILSTTGHTLGHVAAGWRPLCWLPPRGVVASLLAARGGQLATIPVRGGDGAAPAVFAAAPPGQSVYAGSCARVRSV